LLLKRAPANVRGVWCGFLKQVNRPPPEADRHLLKVSSLRIRVCVCGAVPNLPIRLHEVVLNKHNNNLLHYYTASSTINSMCLLMLYKLAHLLILPLPSLTFHFNAIYFSVLSLSPLFLDLFIVQTFKTITQNTILYLGLMWTNRKLPSIAKWLIPYSRFQTSTNNPETKRVFVTVALSVPKKYRSSNLYQVASINIIPN